MPVFNGEAFLAEALDSLLAQEMGDFELIVSDNASSDGTPDILEAYAARDKRIRVRRRDETVIAWDNYNGLVGEASAPLFTWAACDDLRDPTCLSVLAHALESRPDAVLAHSAVRLFGDAHRVSRNDDLDRPVGDEETRLGRLISLLRSRRWHLVYGLIRTEALRRTRLFFHPMGFNSDVGLCLELATQGPFVFVPKPLLSFRLHPKSLSLDRDDPINVGHAGRRFDPEAQTWAEAVPLDPKERRIFLMQLAVWCRKAQKPRRGVWRSAGFRSLYVRTANAWIDLRVALSGL
jgi:GT2 family glycosyltransferase